MRSARDAGRRQAQDPAHLLAEEGHGHDELEEEVAAGEADGLEGEQLHVDHGAQRRPRGFDGRLPRGERCQWQMWVKVINLKCP